MLPPILQGLESSVILFIIFKRRYDVTTNIAEGVYPLCDIVHNIKEGRSCYPQYHKGCTPSVILFVISKEGDEVMPSITEGVPTL